MAFNLAPFLFNMANCFTALIFYEHVDFHPPEFPIATMEPRYAHYPNSSCMIPAEQMNKLALARQNILLCPYVVENLSIKGTTCIGVTSIYPSDGYGESDIYWYLNYYWSRSEAKRINHNGNPHIFFRKVLPVLPPDIRIQIIMKEIPIESPEFSPIVPGLGNLARLPMVIISVPRRSIESENFNGELAIVLNGLSPFRVESVQVDTKRRVSSAEMDQIIDNVIKNKMKVHVRYIPWNTTPLHETLIQFIAQTFNQTITAGIQAADMYRTITILTHKYATLFYDANTEGIRERRIVHVGITCSGSDPIASWSYLHLPYDKISWTLLGILLGIGTVVVRISLNGRGTTEGIQALVSIFLEQSYQIKETKKALIILCGIFLLMGIVLSNGYKGVVTSSVVKPFQRSRLKTMKDAIDNNFKFLPISLPPTKYGIFGVDVRGYCCRNERGLSLILKSSRLRYSRKLPKFIGCRDMIPYKYRYQLVNFMRNQLKSKIIKKHFHEYGNLNNFNLEQNDTLEDKLLVYVMKNAEAFDCAFKTLWEQLFICDKTVALITVIENFKLKFEKRYDPNANRDNPVYSIEDENNNIFKVYYKDTSVSPLNIAKRFVRTLRAFVYTGIKQKKIEEEVVDNGKIIEQMNEHYGKLEDKTNIERPVDLDSNIYYVLLLYLYLIFFVIITLIVEVCIYYGSYCTEKVFGCIQKLLC